MQLIILLTVFLAGCADDGAFDFSRMVSENNNETIQNNNEGGALPENGSGENPICLSVQGIDGPNGFLWKPISESNGNLVVLFPTEYSVKFESVVIDGEQGRFADFANGNRQHWRFSKPGSQYLGRVVAESMNGECVWQVSNPSERQD